MQLKEVSSPEHDKFISTAIEDFEKDNRSAVYEPVKHYHDFD